MRGEWEAVGLEDLVDPDRGISYGIVQPGASVDAGVPIVRVSDIRNGRIATTNPMRVSPRIEAAYARTRLRGGELLLTLVGTVGEAAVVPDSLAGWNTARAVAVIPVREDITAYWVKLALSAPTVREIIDSSLNTTVQATLNLRDVATLPIILPPEPERRAISYIVGALDAKIELSRRVSETLEATARGLFQSWFVEFDPVRAKSDGHATGLPKDLSDLFPNRLVDSELGEIPQTWKIVRLSELIETVKGRSYNSRELVDSDTALVTLKSFKRGGGYRPNGLKSFMGTYRADQVVKPGELVIACTDVTQAADVIGRPAIVRASRAFQTLVASLDTLIVRPKRDGIGHPFLYCLTRTEAFVAHTYAHTTGTTVLHLARDAVPSFEFACAPNAIVDVFDQLARKLFGRIYASELEADSLASLRDALLPRLVSGELRFRDAERFVERVL